jgi:hypothetical protein
MNQRNLIIGAIVLVGGYFVYKKFYTKKPLQLKPLPIKPLPIKPILDANGNPVSPIIDKGEPIVPTPIPTSSFDFDDFNDEIMPYSRNRR